MSQPTQAPQCPTCGNTSRWDRLIIDDNSARGTCGHCGAYVDIPYAAGPGSFTVSNLDVRGPAMFGSGNTMTTHSPAGPTSSEGSARPLTDRASFERHDPAADALHWPQAREQRDAQGRLWVVNPDTGERVRADGQLMDDGTVRYPNGDVEPARNWPPARSSDTPAAAGSAATSSPAGPTSHEGGPRPLTDPASFERHNPAAAALTWTRTHEEEDAQGRLWMINRDTGERVRVDGQVMDDGTVRYPDGQIEPARNWPPDPPPAAAAPAAPNATFWNHTRQETDEAGRRWLVNRETGERVRLDGELMDDGTVRYPNGDVESASEWNRITPDPAASPDPRTSGHPDGQNPPSPAATAAPTQAGPWSTPPAAGAAGIPGEITGLVSAQAYAQGMSAAFGSHISVIETFVAVLVDSDVSGDAVTCAVRAQELTLQTTHAWAAANTALTKQHGVRDAYAAAPGAGSKQWVTQGG